MNSKMLTAICIAACAGVVAGILMAPDKGSETRRKISNKMGDLKDGVADKMNEFSNVVKDKVSTGADAISKAFSSAKEKSTEWADDIESSLS